MAQLKPLLIIALGPTGSGKSSIPDKVSKILNREDEKFTYVLIDNLVENHEYYKQEVKELIKKLQQQVINTQDSYQGKTFAVLTDDEKKDVNKSVIQNISTPENIKAFEKAYFETRDEIECSSNKSPNPTPNITSCNVVNDELLRNSLRSRKSIVFESTGESFPDWLFGNYKDQLKEYDVVVTWSIVGICELIKRNISRTQESLKTFLKSIEVNDSQIPEAAGPRLPDMSLEVFKKKVHTITETFKIEAEKCEQYTKCACIFRILVFNNNNKGNTEGNLLYDSSSNIAENKNKSITEIVEMYQSSTVECPKDGGKYKSLRNVKNKKSKRYKSCKNKSKKNKTRKNLSKKKPFL